MLRRIVGIIVLLLIVPFIFMMVAMLIDWNLSVGESWSIMYKVFLRLYIMIAGIVALALLAIQLLTKSD